MIANMTPPKFILGHSQRQDVTNSVYIHTDKSYLYDEMLKYGFYISPKLLYEYAGFYFDDDLIEE